MRHLTALCKLTPLLVPLQLIKIPTHLPPAGVCLCIAEPKITVNLRTPCPPFLLYPIPFTSAAVRQDMYSSSFLSPNWKSLKPLLTWETAGKGIWRREMSSSTEKFCVTSKTREIHKTGKETQPMQQSWRKSRNGDKNLAWVGEVVSLGISNCGWISALRDTGETETGISNLISVPQKASCRIRDNSP